ncbi:hypothetical protein D3C76_1083200 [compost metagenome]
MLHQAVAGFLRCPGTPDQGDDPVQMVQSNTQAFQNMGASFSLAQLIFRSAADNRLLVLQVVVQAFFQTDNLRLIIHQSQHVDAEVGLHSSMLVQVIQHHIGIYIPAELNHHPHAVAVRFVPQVGNAVDPFLPDQLSDILDQTRLVHLVWQLIYNNPGFAVVILNINLGPHGDSAPAGIVRGADALAADDIAAGREVRPLDKGHEIHGCGIRELDHVLQPVYYLTQIMGRNIRRHPYGNTGNTVYQQVGETGGQHDRFLLFTVIVGLKVNGFFIDIP